MINNLNFTSIMIRTARNKSNNNINDNMNDIDKN